MNRKLLEYLVVALVAAAALWPAVGIIAETELWRIATAQALLIAGILAVKRILKEMEDRP